MRDFDISLDDVTPLLARASAVGAPTPANDGGLQLDDYFRLLRRMSDASGEETFALSNRPMKRGAAEFAVSQAAGAADLGEAMHRIAQAYNLMHGGDYNRVERHGRLVTYLIADEGYPYTRPRDSFLHLTLESALIFVHASLCELARQDLCPRVRRVATRRAEDDGHAVQALAFWDAPIDHGGVAYALSYDAQTAAMPVRRPAGAPGAYLAVHTRILELIGERRGRPQAPGGVAGAVRRLLDDGVREQEAVAARLGVSVATLRRRLLEAGACFRTLRHEAMNAHARRRLQETADVGQVSEELGFSDARAFTRAFKAWNGATPTGWMRDPAAAVSETVPPN